MIMDAEIHTVIHLYIQHGFNFMADLRKALKNLDVSKLKTSSGKSVSEELKHHAAILADCIMYRLDEVYESYSPKIYKRTYNLYNSIYIDQTPVLKIGSSGAAICISVLFDDGAIHQSLNGKYVDVAMLLNEGWQTHGSFANVPYFGYRPGTHFIEKGIEDYKRKVDHPFDVQFIKNQQ